MSDTRPDTAFYSNAYTLPQPINISAPASRSMMSMPTTFGMDMILMLSGGLTNILGMIAAMIAFIAVVSIRIPLDDSSVLAYVPITYAYVTLIFLFIHTAAFFLEIRAGSLIPGHTYFYSNTNMAIFYGACILADFGMGGSLGIAVAVFDALLAITYLFQKFTVF